MSTVFRPLWRVRRLLGWDSVPQKAAAPTAPRIPQPTMKKPALPPVKTYGSGQETMDVYGAIPLSKEQVQRGAQEAKLEALEHEKEIAPVKSFQHAGSPANGIGLLDPAFVARIQDWERKQKVFSNTGQSIDEILPNARGQPPPPIKLGHAL